jgi:ectoine hydroxylase-related dioxygenase (phytanoyl-CoA dioxygenase family)
MPKVLTSEQVERYHHDGILFPIPVLEPDEVDRFRDAYYDLEARLGGRPSPRQLGQTHLHFRWSYDLATHPRVLDAVEDVLGPDILIWTVSIFPKHAHDSAYISWHQDGTYWGLSSTQVTTAWIALTDSTVDNGCMRVVAGSHTRPIQPHTETWAKDNLLSRGQEIQVEVRDDDATDVVLRAGEMSLHHVNIIHGSNPNRSDRRRVGYAIRFTVPAVSQVGERSTGVLARGRDDYHHFELLAEPPSGSVEDGIRAQAETARRMYEALTKTPSAAR